MLENQILILIDLAAYNMLYMQDLFFQLLALLLISFQQFISKKTNTKLINLLKVSKINVLNLIYHFNQFFNIESQKQESNKEINDSNSNENSRCDEYAGNGSVANFNINPLVDSSDLLNEKLIKVINENSNPKRKLSNSSKHKIDQIDVNYK